MARLLENPTTGGVGVRLDGIGRGPPSLPDDLDIAAVWLLDPQHQGILAARPRATFLRLPAAGGAYNGFTDRAIDARVDDGPDPIGEMARLTRLAVVNDTWNRGWTAFTGKRCAEALLWQRQTASMAADAPGFGTLLNRPRGSASTTKFSP